MENNPPDTLLSKLVMLGENLALDLDDVEKAEQGVPAAVLAPLVLPRWNSPREESKLLFIKRSDSLRKHSGQMAFPGGVVEPGDPDLLSAGFREGHEEVGLHRDKTRLLATLPSAFTPTGFMLQPYFVATTQQQFTPQPDEVDSIHLITVDELMHCPVRLEHREWKGVNYRVIYFDTSTVCIWGVTGRITEVLLSHFFGWEPPGE